MNLFRFRQPYLQFNSSLGLTLIFLFGIPRFFIVLNANMTGSYGATSLIFISMWLVPFLLLKRDGRKQIGICKPKKYQWLIYAFVLGMVAAAIGYFIATFIYSHAIENWYVYISKSYRITPNQLQGSNRSIYFAIFAGTSMIFSPIGEELLYRGLIHESFVPQFGENKASIIDSSAFALTHLAHFGFVYTAGKWQFFLVPALLWVIFMFLTSRLFYFFRKKSGSIYGALLGHAGFNLTMTYFIFYHIM